MYDLERPFHRLIHHYVVRIFHGAGDGDDLQFSIPALLGLLSVPSAFAAINLLSKYSTLRLFLLGIQGFDVYRASVPDEYFFIVYSFVVTGAVVILKWDRLFPDRQDYDNLAALPLSARQNFIASLTALLFLASLFAGIINAAASLIFPLAVTSTYNTFWSFLEFAVAHSVAVVLASLFACFGLLLLMGLTILVTPRRYVRPVSLAVRILCALGLIATLGTVFTMPRVLSSPPLPGYAFYIPTVWFLDLHQMLLAHGTQLLGAGGLCLVITGATFVLALLIYALTYYREYIRIPETSGLVYGGGRDSYSMLRRCLEGVLLRTPFQRATFHFAVKTLFRSERHCLLFGTAAAVGVFLSAEAVGDTLANPIAESIDPRLLSVSLTIAYCAVVSLRALFDLPSDRNASWVFRSILDLNRHEGRESGTKVMIATVVPWLLLPALPLHIALWGWGRALLHTLYVLMCSIALSEVLLLRFRKIPFTCLYTASKDRVLMMIFFALAGFYVFSGANSSLEAVLLRRPIYFLFVIPIFTSVLLWIREYQAGLSQADRALIFEDRPAAAIQLLNLSR